MRTQAIIIREPKRIERDALVLDDPRPDDLIVEVNWSGISTGTERMFWTGEMPDFPGMGYPLVPGYESAGRVVEASGAHRSRIGEAVFIPGAACFGPVRGLFGATAARLVVPAARAVTVEETLGERAVLLALAATAYHVGANAVPPDLIVGHGVVGRLLARLALLGGGKPVVWETNPARRNGAEGYTVCAPEEDERRGYANIFEASGNADVLDTLVQRLAPGGEIVLAGFYQRLGFAFAPAFMREARFRIAAQWRPDDLAAVCRLVAAGTLSLDGLITHRVAPGDVGQAYGDAFTNPDCLKMIFDWNSK